MVNAALITKNPHGTRRERDKHTMRLDRLMESRAKMKIPTKLSPPVYRPSILIQSRDDCDDIHFALGYTQCTSKGSLARHRMFVAS